MQLRLGIVLTHALFILFGKASLRFFEVVDSESIGLDSKFYFCESLESMEVDSVIA